LIVSAVVVIFVIIASAMTAPMSSKTSNNTEWLTKTLKEIQTIKVGMTRKELLEKFTAEGGFSSRAWRTYAYRECTLIKVDVEFEPAGASEPQKENPDDKITKISKPYLEQTVLD
jgi:hypothetical protein